VLDTDIAARDSLHRADVMVSDWSGAALEFAFGLERPVVYVDVPRKVNNPEYERVGIEPFEASVRERIGALCAPDALAALPDLVRRVCSQREAMRAQIRATRDECVYNVGTSGAAAADYIAGQAKPYLARVGAP
jgi:YidC/Oxa1 family membrane protein insertase